VASSSTSTRATFADAGLLGGSRLGGLACLDWQDDRDPGYLGSLSVHATAFVIVRLAADAQPEDVAAERIFRTREEAEAELKHLSASSQDTSRRYVKEGYFFSGSAVPRPND